MRYFILMAMVPALLVATPLIGSEKAGVQAGAAAEDKKPTLTFYYFDK